MIHILTLTWNGLDKLQRLKNGLIANVEKSGQTAKWYIRSNGCTDGTVDWLKNWDNKLELYPLYIDHNKDNFAKCVNSLYLEANIKNDDYILLLNNDIKFVDNISLYNMLKLIKNPNIGAVGARLLYFGTNKLQHAGVIFSKKYGYKPYHYRHKEESDKQAEKNRYFQAVTAACCLIRGEAFEQLDECFFWCFEDIDLMLRIGNSGWKIAYCGHTKIYHEESATLSKNPVHKMFLQHNVKHFQNKWFGKYDIDHDKYLKNKNYNII